MKINRILASLLAVTVVGANMPAVSMDFPKISLTANAEETESPLKYKTLDDGTIEITGCDKTVTEVEIPAEIDGKKVTSIGSMAFYCCSSLTEITIPNSITSIGAFAFETCSGLTSITIPKSVTRIGYGAFSGTQWLENKQKDDPLVIVNGILIDGTTCSGDVAISDSVTSIGDGAFGFCSNLTSIAIPDSVTSIGESAFWACSGLTSITIPDSVTSIGDGAFGACSGLTSITIPDSVTSIDQGAFERCSSLTSITILNPNCEIYDGNSTISNGYERNKDDFFDYIYYFNGTIYGYENSTAQAYAEKYEYNFELIGDAPENKVIAGDANCDGKVSIADATAILQHLGNQDKYGLSAEGLKNADVDGNDGVSTNDALVIQKVDAKILTVEQLPLKK